MTEYMLIRIAAVVSIIAFAVIAYAIDKAAGCVIHMARNNMMQTPDHRKEHAA